MSSPAAPVDRRAALKARHRQAILDAADSLIEERGKPTFSVDELAERADVARRTIFNHFSSLDEVILASGARVLTGAIDEFRAAAASHATERSTRLSLFAEMTAIVRGMDLPTLIAYLWRVLATEGDDGRPQSAVQAVFTKATQQLSLELAERSDELDELEAEILVSSMMNGMSVVARHWIDQTGAALDDDSRRVWDELLDRLITIVRNGYLS